MASTGRCSIVSNWRRCNCERRYRFGAAGSTLGAMGCAALGNIASQAVSVAIGLQKHVDWRNVAASAAGGGGGAGYAASEAFAGLKVDNIFTRAASNISGVVASAVVRSGKIDFAQIATDAFGNARSEKLDHLLSLTTSAWMEK